MFNPNPLTSSFCPQDPQPDQDVKTPFEASLNAYSFFGIHGVKVGQEQVLEAVYEEEEEPFAKEQEMMEQRKIQEETRRIALWKSKYAKKYEREERLEKVYPVMPMVPAIKSPIFVQPIIVIQPIIMIIPVQIVYVYFLHRL